jgi:hypothetical protein
MVQAAAVVELQVMVLMLLETLVAQAVLAVVLVVVETLLVTAAMEFFIFSTRMEQL